MVNKKYTIIQFDTDDFYQYTLDLVLYNMGLDSVIRASDKDETRALVDKVEKGSLKPDVAIVDTYIGIDNNDGKKIAEKLRTISPKTKIIGYSIMETNDWADYEIIKSGKDQTKTLVHILEKVLEIPFNYSEAEEPEHVSSIPE